MEEEVCFICASPVVHNAVSPCNHRTCHLCALRLRALYKTKACAHCRTEAASVILTDDAVKRFEVFKDSDFARRDDNLGIKYESLAIFEDTVLLLRYNCPDSSCDVACLGWPDLHRHVRHVHHKRLCDLCTRNKRIFTHEHELFTDTALRLHEKFGDDKPGASDQTGFKGHPECGFCRQRFYGDDELFIHCRDKHERCHVCDRQNPTQKPAYFLDYPSLEQHFRKDHFPCMEKECLEKKFVVFGSEMDLKAHQVETHSNVLSKEARRDARRIDISSFDYRASQAQTDRGNRGREGRGRGRGRDPNTDPIPQSIAHPLRRDELAYQRQMAIQSTQSISTRTFGGQLTTPSASTPLPSSSQPRQQNLSSLTPSDAQPPTSNPANLSLTTSSRPTLPSTPQEHARHLAHTAVLARASTLLHHFAPSLTTFRGLVSQYQASSITASSLTTSLVSLFSSTPKPELSKLFKELASIYESPRKSSDLLTAWRDHLTSSQSEDYPALSSSSSTVPETSTATLGGGARILRLKSSTARTAQSHVSQTSSWVGVNGGARSSTSITSPPLPHVTSNTALANSDRKHPSTTTTANSWLQPTPSSTNSSTRKSTTQSRPSLPPPPPRSGNKNNAANDAFPALPEAKKPVSTIFGYGTGAVRRDNGKVPLNGSPWGVGRVGTSGGESGSGGESAEDGFKSGTDASGVAGGKRKPQGKGKKTTLFQWG